MGPFSFRLSQDTSVQLFLFSFIPSFIPPSFRLPHFTFFLIFCYFEAESCHASFEHLLTLLLQPS